MDNEHYKIEIAKADKAKRSFDDFINPFIKEKRTVLFEAFQSISITDVDDLLEVKRQLMAIDALDDEIQTIINTGKMAMKSLADLEK